MVSNYPLIGLALIALVMYSIVPF